jgi:Ni/Co efflux regulator RcnB
VQSPRGSIVRSSGAHAQHAARPIANKCACAKSANHHRRREADENRKNEQHQKHHHRKLIKIGERKQQPLSIEEINLAKNQMHDKLAKINKWEINNSLSNGYRIQEAEHEYTVLTKKVQMLE